MRQNADQNNSEYGHFLCSVALEGSKQNSWKYTKKSGSVIFATTYHYFLIFCHMKLKLIHN